LAAVVALGFLMTLAAFGFLAVLAGSIRSARAAGGCNTTTTTSTTTTTTIPCGSATTPECDGSCATAGKVCVEVVGRGCQCVSSSMPTCEIGLCVAADDLCEPCLGAGRLGSPGFGFCAKTVEDDLRCQVAGCVQPSSNCTSSAQCQGDQFCGLNGGGSGVNACCPLCLPVLQVPIICSAQGDQCGKLVGEFGTRW